MENKSDKMLNDNKESSLVDNVLGVDKGVLKNFTQSSDVTETRIAADWKGGESCPKGARAEEIDAAGDVNMEASITPDDVIRAGGFGARDDISSFLPVASDSTDFEASIRDARDYEEPQGQVSRPGLGWTGAAAEGE
ncbi:uncharacterized protein LOC106752539 isoform X2 [Vigna radiata var. radiata]|uniref:Uncharacterized protein LOC106752539 isoform X2 n=1 Tax=Vigna radiata var. radiata TaxID=3916 RepID=A0A1S3T7H4_VIGRR|nr:uncharacterized protein LOC106752539 isoform X2 [Vigna radiata var. radiata]XP_014489722.1 uncharacterized protein LOC106752539 isoform X2 [Vigna radiata var. radiata]XP_022632879.1 uncharacterized protein LOC106752539 isoform X2 [Vigna radiata var. radiata]